MMTMYSLHKSYVSHNYECLYKNTDASNHLIHMFAAAREQVATLQSSVRFGMHAELCNYIFAGPLA